MTIDRCSCFNVLFGTLKEVAEREDVSNVRDLQAHCPFGLRCRLCHPYVRRMLRTGEVVFHQIVTDEDEPDGTLFRSRE